MLHQYLIFFRYSLLHSVQELLLQTNQLQRKHFSELFTCVQKVTQASVIYARKRICSEEMVLV